MPSFSRSLILVSSASSLLAASAFDLEAPIVLPPKPDEAGAVTKQIGTFCNNDAAYVPGVSYIATCTGVDEETCASYPMSSKGYMWFGQYDDDGTEIGGSCALFYGQESLHKEACETAGGEYAEEYGCWMGEYGGVTQGLAACCPDGVKVRPTIALCENDDSLQLDRSYMHRCEISTELCTEMKEKGFPFNPRNGKCFFKKHDDWSLTNLRSQIACKNHGGEVVSVGCGSADYILHSQQEELGCDFSSPDGFPLILYRSVSRACCEDPKKRMCKQKPALRY